MTTTPIVDTDRRVARNIRLAMDNRGFNNETLAAAIGKPGKSGRNWVQARTSGTNPVPVTVGWLERIAGALGIPSRVLQGEPEHVYLYLGNHPELSEHLRRHPSPWMAMHPGQLDFMAELEPIPEPADHGTFEFAQAS